MEHLNKIENVRINLCPLLEGNNISSEVQPLKSSASNIIEKILEDANSKKEKIQNSLNADKIKKLENKKRELESNNIANSKRDQINNRIIYLRVSEKYRNAIKRTNTTAISSKAREIVNRSLADRFREKLLGELSCLGGDRLNLLAKPSTIKGKLTYEMSLKEASMQASIDHVFSEGEQNITSLAGFLAETKMSGHKNGIIFDDPVTSLDHLFRERVAERLVKEAKERQVIIFTHDLVFFHELIRSAKLEVSVLKHKILKSKGTSGIVSEGGWEKLNINGRITEIKNIAKEIKTRNIESESKEYSEKVTLIYSYLRETWERGVEEIMLNRVVTRLDAAVRTQNLHKVYVDDDDYRTVYRSMSRCSKFTGHDQPPVSWRGTPSIKEIEKDILEIEKFFKDRKERIKEVVKRRAG